MFFPTIDQQQISVVFDLGDTFDRRKFVNFVTLSRCKQFFFDQLAKRNIEYHAIVGNHSTYFKNTNYVNSMDQLLTQYDNINIYVDRPVELTFDRIKFLLVPWITSDNQQVSMDALRQSSADIVGGHFDINGFEMIRGRISDHGLDRSMFAKYQSVWSGHYHHPSQQANIQYLGAPYEMNWGDYQGRRGFHIFDTSTNELTHVANPNTMFHKIYYDDGGLTVTEIEQLDPSSLTDTYVRVIVTSKSNPYLFEMLINKLHSGDPADLKIVDESINFESISNDEILTEKKGTRDAMHDYVDTRLDTLDSDRRDKLKALLDSLYNEANAL